MVIIPILFCYLLSYECSYLIGGLRLQQIRNKEGLGVGPQKGKKIK
jgi:hypothetical protein